MVNAQRSADILAIVRDNVPVGTPEVTDPAANLFDHGIDSLDFASILLAVEEKYEISISDEEMERLVCVNDIAAFVGQRT